MRRLFSDLATEKGICHNKALSHKKSILCENSINCRSDFYIDHRYNSDFWTGIKEIKSHQHGSLIALE